MKRGPSTDHRRAGRNCVQRRAGNAAGLGNKQQPGDTGRGSDPSFAAPTRQYQCTALTLLGFVFPSCLPSVWDSPVLANHTGEGSDPMPLASHPSSPREPTRTGKTSHCCLWAVVSQPTRAQSLAWEGIWEVLILIVFVLGRHSGLCSWERFSS